MLFTLRHVIKNNNPSTYTINFFEPKNRIDIVNSSTGKTYFYRELPHGVKSIKINIPHKGIFSFDGNAVIKQGPLRITNKVNNIKLPPPERQRRKPYKIIYDPKVTSSPAIIYTELGLIVTGPRFKQLTQPMKEFILLHEIGHFDYETEKYCDLYAAKEFIRMGGNPSTAIYCLTDVLRNKPQNDERIKYVYNNFLKAGLVN